MAPSHVDLSVLWVPIMPETSKLGEQMEQVGKDATESFGKGSTGLGDKIHESVTKSRDKIKDVFQRTGSDAGKSMSDAFKEETKAVEDTAEDVGKKAQGKFRESTKGWGKVLVDSVGPETKRLLGDRLEETVGGALEGVLGDNAKWAGKLSHTVADWGFDELKTKLLDVKDAAGKTKQAFASFKDGDTLGGVSTLVDSFDKLGIGVKDLPSPLQDVIGDISTAKGAAQEFADIFKDMPGKVGLVGAAIGDLAGPIAIATVAATALFEGIQQIRNSPTTLDTSPENLGLGVPNSVSVQTPASIMALPGMPQPVAAGSIPANGQGHEYVATQGSLDPFAALLPPGMAAPDLSKPSPLAPIDMPDGTNPHPFITPPMPPPAPPPPVGGPGMSGVPLVQKPDGTWTSSNPAWAHLIARESGGNPGIQNNYDSNAQAGDPSQGLFQFTRATWAAHGGLKYGRDPGKATPQQQAEIAANLIKANPSGSDWGAGMSGRESASGLLSGVGSSGAASTGWWGTSGAGVGGSNSAPMPSMPRAGGTTASGDKIPTGAQHDPLFVSAAGGGAAGSDGAASAPGGDNSSLAQQLGSGLLGGVAQSVGLDGSVFKTFSGASNPMDFGITKIGTGLLNWASGMMPGISGHSQTKQQPQGHTYNVDQSFNVTQHGVEGNGETPFKAAMNSSGRTEALAANMPGPG